MSVLRLWFLRLPATMRNSNSRHSMAPLNRECGATGEAKHTGQIHVGGENLHRPTAKVLFQVVAELRIKGLE